MNSKPKSLKSNPSVLLRLTRIATKYIDSPRLILQDKIDFPLAGLLILKFDFEESFPIFCVPHTLAVLKKGYYSSLIKDPWLIRSFKIFEGSLTQIIIRGSEFAIKYQLLFNNYNPVSQMNPPIQHNF